MATLTNETEVRERLAGRGGIDEPFPEKPKGMHWKTYERLRQQEARLQGDWALGIIAKYSPLSLD